MNIPLFVFCENLSTQKILNPGIGKPITKIVNFNSLRLTFFDEFANAAFIFNVLKFVIVPVLIVIITFAKS